MTDPFGFVSSLVDSTHQFRRVIEIGVRPLDSGRVRLAIRRDAGPLISHEIAVSVVHEREVPRVSRRDDGLTERHRLGHREPEPLAPMEGYVAVAGRHHAVALL